MEGIVHTLTYQSKTKVESYIRQYGNSCYHCCVAVIQVAFLRYFVDDSIVTKWWHVRKRCSVNIVFTYVLSNGIQVRIGLHYPLACCKRQLNRVNFWMTANTRGIGHQRENGREKDPNGHLAMKSGGQNKTTEEKLGYSTVLRS